MDTIHAPFFFFFFLCINFRAGNNTCMVELKPFSEFFFFFFSFTFFPSGFFWQLESAICDFWGIFPKSRKIEERQKGRRFEEIAARLPVQSRIVFFFFLLCILLFGNFLFGNFLFGLS